MSSNTVSPIRRQSTRQTNNNNMKQSSRSNSTIGTPTFSNQNSNNNSNSSTVPHGFERQVSGEPGMFVAVKEAAASFSEYYAHDPGCLSLTCAHPALEPFPHFVCRVLNNPLDSLLGRIIEQAASLYLFRNDPDSLRQLMEFWYHFKNFCDEQVLPPPLEVCEETGADKMREPTETEKEIMEKRGQSREQLLKVVMSNSNYVNTNNNNSKSLDSSSNNDNNNNDSSKNTPPPSPTGATYYPSTQNTSTEADFKSNNNNNMANKSGEEPDKNNNNDDESKKNEEEEDIPESTKTLNPLEEEEKEDDDEPFQLTAAQLFEVFLATQMGVIQSCLEAYFSTDWHRQQDVMIINRQHRDFMRKRAWTKYLVEGYKAFRQKCTEIVLDTNITSEQEKAEMAGEVLGKLWEERNNVSNNNNTAEAITTANSSSRNSSAPGSARNSSTTDIQESPASPKEEKSSASNTNNSNQLRRSMSTNSLVLNSKNGDNSNNTLTTSTPSTAASPNFPTLVPLPEERQWLDFEVIDPNTLKRLEADTSRTDTLLIVFHAAFSTPSTIFVSSTLTSLREEIREKEHPIRILVVNASVEISLLLQYEVEEFPSVYLIPPFTEEEKHHFPPPSLHSSFSSKTQSPATNINNNNKNVASSAGAAATTNRDNSSNSNHFLSAPPTTSNTLSSSSSNLRDSFTHQQHHQMSINSPHALSLKARRKKFPTNGVLNKKTLLEWVLSNGTSEVPEKKLKKFVTKLVKLEQRLRFAPLRKLASAANTVRRLCSGGSSSTSCSPLEILRTEQEMTESDRKALAEKDVKNKIDDSKETTSQKSKSCSTSGQHHHHRHSSSFTATEPRFIFLGGGAASGKSTAVMALKTSPWWEENHNNIVVVDADEFKRHDPLYKGNVSDLHQQSVSAAEFLLVSAVNEGRHVIFDSTMMWAPFVEQTVAMIRDSRMNVYEKGPGWQGENLPELYWNVKHARCEEEIAVRHPYSISIYGIFADPARSVPRCLVRELTSGRTLLVAVLLKSLKLFAQSFEHYCELVDEAVLFDNNVYVDLEKGELPPTAAKKDAKDSPLEILDDGSFQSFMKHRKLNPRATKLDDLYESEDSQAKSK